MKTITCAAFKAISRYFTTLSQYGYKSYNDVDKLIVLLYIEELLSGEIDILVPEKDLRVIQNAICCLTGTTCLIPFMGKSTEDTIFHKYQGAFIPRYTNPDKDNPRSSISGELRIKS